MAATVTEHVVRRDGVVVASATVVADDDRDVAVRVIVAGGHVPVGARRELVDGVFADAALPRGRQLRVVIPLGDPELMTAFGAHLDGMHARAAGASCLLDGAVAGAP